MEFKQIKEIGDIHERATQAKRIVETMSLPTDLNNAQHEQVIVDTLQLGYETKELITMRKELSGMSNDAISSPELMGPEIQLNEGSRDSMVKQFAKLASLPTDLKLSEAKVLYTLGLTLGISVSGIEEVRQDLSHASLSKLKN